MRSAPPPPFRLFLWPRRLLLAGVLAAVGVGRAEYLAQSWDYESGLAARGVHCLAQTRDGFLWLGTFGPLVRFDGVSFDRMDFPAGANLKGNRVSALWEDAAGDLWFGRVTGDVVVWRRSRNIAEVLPMRWPPHPVRAIAGDRTGDIWVTLSDHSLVRVRDGHRLPASDEAALAGAMQLVTTNEGDLWAVRDGRLECVGATAPMPPPEDLGTVRGAARAREGGLWVFARDRYRRWYDGAWREERLPNPAPRTSVIRFIETRSGELVIGTREAGVFVVSTTGVVQHLNQAGGLAHDWVYDLGEEAGGTIAVATAGGFSVLRQRRVQVVNAPDHWRNERLLTVVPAARGGWWVGTEGAGLYSIGPEGCRRFGPEDGLTKEFIWSVLDEGDRGMWVGSWGEGLFFGRNGKFAHAEGWNSRAWVVTALLRTRDGTLWAGTNIGLAVQRGSQWNWLTESGNRPLGSVRCLAEDEADRLWFGTDGRGLGWVDRGRIGQPPPDFRGDSVWALHRGTRGGVWVGTQGCGLARFHEGRWTQIDTARGLPADDVLSIAEDGRGCFWFTSPAGVYAVPAADLEACLDGRMERIQPLLVDRSDGLPTTDCAGGSQGAASMMEDGRLVVPTAKGLAVIPTREIDRKPRPLNVSFTGATIDDRGAPIDPVRGLEAGPGARRIEVRFAAPDFAAPGKIRFRYQLLGFDDRWLELGDRRSVLFSYLRSGRYELCVSAVNGNGAASPAPAVLPLLVRPTLLETVWFRWLVGVALVVAVAAAVWAAMHARARRRLGLLERQHAVERERTRIARDIHDDLGASLARIMMLSQPVEEGPPAAGGEQGGKLRQVHAVARSVTRVMDELVWAVNPRHDTLESFASYCARLAQEVAGEAGLRCRLRIPPLLPEIRLGAGIRHHLLLGLKESLRNVVRHAGAAEVAFGLGVDDGWLRLEVADDGAGFDPEARPPQPGSPGGNGLPNLRARMAEIGGRLELASAPGRGTRVLLVAPLPSAGQGS